MEKEDGRNRTLIMEFILLGFGDVSGLEPLLILLFLLIYIVTIAGNLLIVALVVVDHNLHTPMYFFLGNLDCVEICYSSTILPVLLAELLTGDRTICVHCCLAQLYSFGIMKTGENLLLTAMSYDRYLAICHPLRYAALMNGRVCCQLVVGCWLCTFLVVGTLNYFFFSLTFCDSKEIDHYFCDFSPMMKLSCSDTRTLQLVTLIISAIGTVVPLLLTLASYVCIITAILRIPSSIGRQKAFSTCSSHLIVVSILYITLIIVYVFPSINTSTVLHKVFSLFYTVLNPMITPIIYSLRNKEVKKSLTKAIVKLIAFKNRHRI
ncbi:olfactory receptor 10K1-like [Pelodiscus sinensis]|uniref:olfactory receptor 10K1-like n=1 Tax=Pelodiscus sinensis TaxID=13735 RepID=UPI003F6AB462